MYRNIYQVEDSSDSDYESEVSSESSIEQGTKYPSDSSEGYPLKPPVPINNKNLRLRYIEFIKWLDAFLYNLQHAKPVPQDFIEEDTLKLGRMFEEYLRDISEITNHTEEPSEDVFEDIFEQFSDSVGREIDECTNNFTYMVEAVLELDYELHNKKVKQKSFTNNPLFRKRGLEYIAKLKKRRMACREYSKELLALAVEVYRELADAALKKATQSDKSETWILDLFDEFVPRFHEAVEALNKVWFECKCLF